MGKFLQVFGRGDCGLYRLLGESYFLRACYVVVGASEEVLFLQGGNVFEGHDKPQTEVCARWCPRFALGKRAVPGPARVPACMATSKLGNSEDQTNALQPVRTLMWPTQLLKRPNGTS